MSRQRRLRRDTSRRAHLWACAQTWKAAVQQQEELSQEVKEKEMDYFCEERDPLEELR